MEVIKYQRKVQKAMNDGFRDHDIFNCSENGTRFQRMYDLWITARAKAGDPFAISLGFKKE